jgi:NADP-dependent 3-hydroxy acid dehydrogenase YdfG
MCGTLHTGIGHDVCVALAQHGAKVIAVTRSAADLDVLTSEVRTLFTFPHLTAFARGTRAYTQHAQTYRHTHTHTHTHERALVLASHRPHALLLLPP